MYHISCHLFYSLVPIVSMFFKLCVCFPGNINGYSHNFYRISSGHTYLLLPSFLANQKPGVNTKKRIHYNNSDGRSNNYSKQKSGFLGPPFKQLAEEFLFFNFLVFCVGLRVGEAQFKFVARAFQNKFQIFRKFNVVFCFLG